jgi:GNAT superfamily N-acetyltransferase
VTKRLAVAHMTDAELAAYLERSREGYVRQRVDLGGEDERDARKTAEQQTAEYFPGGRPGEGHHLFLGRDTTSGQAVGNLWLHERERAAGTCVWIYDVEVAEGRRGSGWGRELMSYAERWAQERGAVEIALNVFGGNAVARGLYASLGYREAAVEMVKRLPT